MLQGILIAMINEEAHVMTAFAGQMHLCDFGGNLPECPLTKNCRGPGGTTMSYPRLYTFE